MARLLIAEDSPSQAREIQFLLEDAAFEVELCANGARALEAIARRAPDLVLTDLQMPELDGLELVEAVRKRFAAVPVVLMTAHGSEELAVEALQRGAASYVPKRRLDAELVPTLRRVLALAGVDLKQQQLLDSLTESASAFELASDMALITPLIRQLQEGVKQLRLCDETGRIRIGVALQEALTNAMLHGNLELASGESGGRSPLEFAEARRKQAPYAQRRVFVSARLTRAQAEFVVRDEGPGFDTRALPNPRSAPNLEETSARGMLLIRTFMDEVSHNARGNEIRMLKRRE